MLSKDPCQDDRRSRLLDALPAIAWSASVKTFRFNYVNPAAETLLGFPAERWLDEPGFWVEHLHPDDRHVADICHSQSLAGQNHELVYRMIAADGRTVCLRDYVNVHVVDGVPVELFGVMVDITREQEAEAAAREEQQALEASEQRYRELVEGVTDILYTVDLEGRFVSLSRSFERSTGYGIEEWIGRPFTELFRSRAGASMHHAAGVDSPRIREYELPAQSGALVTVEVSSHPRYVDGVVAGTIGMARDVTEQRTIARKLDEAKRVSGLGQVAASLAHEFNNVLMGIQPFVEVIARNAGSTRGVSDALGHITRAIVRGKRASQEILRFVNPQESQLFAIDAQTWLPTLLGQLLAALPPSIALRHSMEPAVQFIRGDREHLEQVITNLVFNARDAIGANGTILIEVALTGAPEDGGERVRISVSDDGPGIPPHVLDHIFEPLFTTKRNGTGLGLAIARRLMEGQGGTLTAENRPEGGSAFHLLVPAAEPPSLPMQTPACMSASVKRILLVEDDVSVGSGLQELLKSEGYETTWVRLAADACGAARLTLPQLAIIDVNLPDGNGVDLVPLLREERPDLPIILSTGHVELKLANVHERIISLMKPYELTDLLAAIGNVTAVARKLAA